jgi:hypothetical protein
MVQSTLQRLGYLVSNWLEVVASLLPWLLVIAGAFMVMALVLYALNRDGFFAARDWLAARGRRGVVWLPVLVAVLLGVFALSVAQRAVNLRFANQQNAQFSKLEDPSGGQTRQFSPSAALEEDITYTRTFAIPPDVARRLGNDPEATLGQYINQNLYLGADLVKDIQDGFTRERGALLYTRRITATRRQPVALEVADVGVDFEFGDTGAGRSYYRAAFTGRYSFTNPRAQTAPMRFTFPLPEGSGTLSDFEMTANGNRVQQADLNQGYVWQGNVPANGKIEIIVKYRNQGATTWSYGFGFQREPIQNFKLRVNSPRAVSFQRGSLYPTNQIGTLEWQLKNIITSQSVVLGFPELSLRETLTKLFVFAPGALVAALLWAFLYGWRRNLPLEPSRFALAALGLALGFGISSVLLGYLPAWLAMWLGVLVAAGLGVLTLGTGFALPVVISGLAPLAFLSIDDAGLWLALAAVVALVSLLPRDTLERFRRGLRRTP